MELVDVMRAQHACRYDKPDPLPLEVFYDAVEAARFAPQGGNRQPVRFLIVTDADKRRRLGEWYLTPWRAYTAANQAPQRQEGKPPRDLPASVRKSMAEADDGPAVSRSQHAGRAVNATQTDDGRHPPDRS